ncbi:MAG: outer rane beta-barrel protein, partial [Mucilaginibacter sp.]|nr:outer rane beta-barrel protein [Mucilaginibacter sp.]
FSFNGLPQGKFILLMSYPDYADYVETFTLDAAHPSHEFGSINMRLKAKILQEVMIKGQVTAIKIKGDTTEFNAKAYVIQPNDKVEDLLKQLPGIQVDKDGKITANGQAVNKVLVDGEEFFGDDPTLVTKNLRADMVDKVQLYDKKSDQAAFTGIDDGQKTRTLNIKLKEDKKSGIFGKEVAGIGTNGYYEGQLIFNRFKAKEKYSAYATVANDGKTGLGFQDNSNLGAANNVQINDNGSITISAYSSNDLDSYSGTYDGRGQPLARTGGVHYDTKWNGDKESINTNYKLGSIEVNGLTTTTTQQSLPTGQINRNSSQTFDNYAFRQKLDAIYQVKLDTSANLKIAADGTIKNFRVRDNYLSQSTDSIGSLINRQSRNITNNGDQQVFNASALYTKKFNKPRRTFSWNVSEAYNSNQTKGYLISETDFYTAGVQDSVQNVNQYKTNNTVSSVLNSNMTYTEPLSKTFSIAVNYGLGINNSTQDRKSFDQSAPGKYDIFNKAYSNNYKFNQLTNQAGAILNYSYKNKIIFNFGTKVSDVNFKQVDEYTGIVYKRDFINWLPQAMFQYKPSQQKAVTFNYSGSNTQPNIDQIQPVLVNTDPLYITVGNANLKPSFSNNFNVNYNSYKVLSGSNVYLYGNYSFITDAIVNNTTTNVASGKTTTQYVNLSNKSPYNYSVYFSKGYKISPIDMYIGLNLNTYGNISYSYINGELNRSKTYTYGALLQLSKYVAKKYSFYTNAGPQYTINEFSLQQQSNNNAAGFRTFGSGSYYLPAKFIISSDINYNYTARTQAFAAQYKTIWNASISKTFLKEDKLRLLLGVNDLLNQNINFNRSISGSNITQTTTNGIKRYFLFSVSWDFTKFGTIPAKK